MKIYIPTMGRLEKQHTLDALPVPLRKNVFLVVDDKEFDAHFDMYSESCGVLGVPSSCNSIGKVRQAIIDWHDVEAHGPNIIMLDDDLGFNMRRTDIRSKFLHATEESIIEGFGVVNELLKTHAHGGIRARQMSQDADDIEYNCRTLRALAYNVSVLRKENARFDRLIVMEDFDVTLQLLTKGYPNFNISTIIQGQGTSNAAGGCSTYRDHQRQSEGAYGLQGFHPEFVKVREKKTNWAGWGSEFRTDVTIGWKKAIAKGIANHGLRTF